MKKQSALSWISHNIPELIAAAGLVTAITTTSVCVFTRYILNFTYAGFDEVISLGFVWTVFPGCAAAYKRKMHFGIDSVVVLLPEGIRRIIELGIKVFLLLLTGYLTYLSYILAANAWEKSLVVIGVPYFYVDLSMIVGFGFATWYSLLFLIDALKTHRQWKMSRGGAVNDL